MKVTVAKDPALLGQLAAREAAGVINAAIKKKGCARIVLSTGASQFDTLAALVQEKVVFFLGRVDRHVPAECHGVHLVGRHDRADVVERAGRARRFRVEAVHAGEAGAGLRDLPGVREGRSFAEREIRVPDPLLKACVLRLKRPLSETGPAPFRQV